MFAVPHNQVVLSIHAVMELTVPAAVMTALAVGILGAGPLDEAAFQIGYEKVRRAYASEDGKNLSAYLNRWTSVIYNYSESRLDDLIVFRRKLDPDVGKLFWIRALVREDENDLEGAFSDLAQAKKLGFHKPTVYLEMAYVRHSQHRHKESIDFSSQAIDLEPTAEMYFVRAYSRAKLKHNGALSDLNMALKLDPDHAGAYCNRGWEKEELGDLKGAIEDYSRSISLNHRLIQNYVRRGGAHLKLGNNADAKSDFEMALSIDPHDDNALRGLKQLEH
jgi:tetratricopeptide (TPR) repeat protein